MPTPNTSRSPEGNRICASLVSICALGVLLLRDPSAALAQHTPPGAPDTPPPVTTAEWREDLRQLATDMPAHHKNLFHTMTRTQFDSAVGALDRDLPGLNRDQIVVRMAQLGALVQDGHTGLSYPDAMPSKNWLPVHFVQFSDGIFVRAADPKYAGIVGGRVVRVGDVSCEEAMGRLHTLIPHDPGNFGPWEAWGPWTYLTNSLALHGLGITRSAGSAQIVVEKNGRTVSAEVLPSEAVMPHYINADPPTWIQAGPRGASAPLARRHPDKPYWFALLPDHRTVYLQFNVVMDQPDEPMSAFASSLAKFLEENPVERLVLDTRNNPGGNNTLLRPLLVAIIRSKLNHRGGLYDLIGPVTFSACQNFTNRLDNYADVIFVGKPTGENVNFYGDPTHFTLAHSRLPFSTSGLWWQDKDPRDGRTAISPELYADASFADYLAGRDPALDLALSAIVPPRLADAVLAALPGGEDSVLATYQRFVSAPIHRYTPDPEAELNTLGYRLIGERRLADAVVVLGAVARTHPASANAYDSYGEALMNAGMRDRAIAAYEKSLELNPGNDNGREMLRKLQATSK